MHTLENNKSTDLDHIKSDQIPMNEKLHGESGLAMLKDDLQQDGESFFNADKISEEQLGQYLAKVLNESARQLNPAVVQQLACNRALAVDYIVAREAQTYSHQFATENGSGMHAAGKIIGHYFNQHRGMAGALIAGIMLISIFAIQQVTLNKNLQNSDAFLLASDLPPEAYADKGFNTWLVSKRD